MGLSDDLLALKLMFSSKKKQVEILREHSGGLASDEDLEDIVYGADARYKEKRKQEKAQHRQYLLDHHACSSCYHCRGLTCFYYSDYSYKSPRHLIKIEDPDHTTCQHYKRDYSK